ELTIDFRQGLALRAVWLATAVVACSLSTGSPSDPPARLAVGTWGGDNTGAIVTEDRIHVHFACTLGDFPRPTVLDASGAFSVPGKYVLRAYPVHIGPDLPAQISGVVRGNRLTMTVAVNDTVTKNLVVLGPGTVTLGVDPRMGPCPICDKPPLGGR
ncbi:MAG: hypothetical protein ACT4P7_05655, partial [Gemmatimonadaceae bacterium]